MLASDAKYRIIGRTPLSKPMRPDRRSPARLEDSRAVGHSSENLLENVAIDNLKL
jgi:hypothetical protein